jgi:hypothetical protein
MSGHVDAGDLALPSRDEPCDEEDDGNSCSEAASQDDIADEITANITPQTVSSKNADSDIVAEDPSKDKKAKHQKPRSCKASATGTGTMDQDHLSKKLVRDERRTIKEGDIFPSRAAKSLFMKREYSSSISTSNDSKKSSTAVDTPAATPVKVKKPKAASVLLEMYLEGVNASKKKPIVVSRRESIASIVDMVRKKLNASKKHDLLVLCHPLYGISDNCQLLLESSLVDLCDGSAVTLVRSQDHPVLVARSLATVASVDASIASTKDICASTASSTDELDESSLAVAVDSIALASDEMMKATAMDEIFDSDSDEDEEMEVIPTLDIIPEAVSKILTSGTLVNEHIDAINMTSTDPPATSNENSNMQSEIGGNLSYVKSLPEFLKKSYRHSGAGRKLGENENENQELLAKQRSMMENHDYPVIAASRQSLPIFGKRADFLLALKSNRVIVVSGATGSGRLLDPIACT